MTFRPFSSTILFVFKKNLVYFRLAEYFQIELISNFMDAYEIMTLNRRIREICLRNNWAKKCCSSIGEALARVKPSTATCALEARFRPI